ncbi:MULTISPECIES: NUDIX domain-containing protein [unclassified Bacillus (in: firmicutes)]|uniref:NUDIX hydrolase n=1 Tax=unclassified Bacillus (in: firmicutes) TaxID=185979 RepID=UPI001BE5C30F|nr:MULTISPECIES: NUDIX domain-containing protein [unclassified Bacillus (in: firmicutes)]MBT2636962.1 NUDIX domain-containing protein [Bacillus sp. ISL-39]MBT2660048.1 NUDIX domain-containing protein [Bacillus sp. ISL-45]
MFVLNVEGAVYREGKWLIIERSTKEEHAGGLLSLVGGTVENEGFSTGLLERTLRRELFEEVGITIKDDVKYVRNSSFVLPDGRVVLDVVFYCEIAGGEPYPKSKDEVEAVFWMTAAEVFAHAKAPIWLKESIEEADIQNNKIELK